MHTFKGVLAGREDTRGRFNLVDGGVEGVVYAPEAWYYVEPLRNYLPSASDGELVVYRHSDIKPGEDLKCGVSLPKRLKRGVNQVTAQAEAASSTSPINYESSTWRLRLTTNTYEALGGSEEANREIEGHPEPGGGGVSERVVCCSCGSVLPDIPGLWRMILSRQYEHIGSLG